MGLFVMGGPIANGSLATLAPEMLDRVMGNANFTGSPCPEIPHAAPTFTTAVLIRVCVLALIAALSLVSFGVF